MSDDAPRRPPAEPASAGGGTELPSSAEASDRLPGAPAPAGASADPAPGTGDDDPAATADRARVAAVLEQLRAGVRQRRAELTTVAAASDEARIKLVELRRAELVREPRPTSPRPVVGRLLVFMRKAAYHLFFKWHARAVMAQQNAYNRVAGNLLEDLVEEQGRLTERLVRLERRLAAVEPASAGGASPAGPAAATSQGTVDPAVEPPTAHPPAGDSPTGDPAASDSARVEPPATDPSRR